MLLLAYLEELAAQAIERAHGVKAPALLRPADPVHGDYQVNGVIALAKQQRQNPRELAQKVADVLAGFEPISSAEVAGPGFINLRLSLPWLGRALAEVARDTEREGVPLAERRQKIVVDYSAPNIAKEMHVGHIRSTIIGDSLYRTLGFLGHAVTGDNHVGDWGTQFGLLIVGLRELAPDADLDSAPIEVLERVYKAASAKAKEDPAFAARARAELAKLQKRDPENLAAWQRMIDATKHELDKLYAKLGVRFDLWRGESAYEDMLPEVVKLLLDRGVAKTDQGAVCVFFDDDPELARVKTPFIVQKSDGAFLYSTTDIATVLWRQQHLGTERALYLVGLPQKLHFQQLFSTVRKLGVQMELEHVSFGSVLGKDGKLLRTRAGDSIKLAELLSEAEERATKLIQEEGLEIEAAKVPELARAVGIGAVKYADLSQNRSSDYRFDWDKMISFKGNSGPYLQYAHARIAAIFRKGELNPTAPAEGATLELAHDAEVALGKQLLRFADVVHDAAQNSTPHVICEHLYELARQFSSFYEQCPVLKAEGETQRTRIALCWLTARQLRRGLFLLGIETPERM
jgi:arginyl-tRNA synthetase